MFQLTSPFFQIPLPVSYVPVQMTSFNQKNALYTASYAPWSRHLFSSCNTFYVYHNITPDTSYYEALANYELLIIEADFALEYPQPLLPGLRDVQVQKMSIPTLDHVCCRLVSGNTMDHYIDRACSPISNG